MEHKVVPRACPACGYVMDCAGNMPGEAAAPEPGDYSVCVQCGELLRFISRMRLRRIGRHELEHLPPELLLELARVRRAVLLTPRPPG